MWTFILPIIAIFIYHITFVKGPLERVKIWIDEEDKEKRDIAISKHNANVWAEYRRGREERIPKDKE